MTIQAEHAADWAAQVRDAARDKSQQCHDVAKLLAFADPLRPALIAARNALWEVESSIAYALMRRKETPDAGA
jgi:hypothetical protein